MHFPGGCPRRTLSVIPPCDARTFLMPIPCGAMARGSPTCEGQYTTSRGKSQGAEKGADFLFSIISHACAECVCTARRSIRASSSVNSHACAECVLLRSVVEDEDVTPSTRTLARNASHRKLRLCDDLIPSTLTLARNASKFRKSSVVAQFPVNSHACAECVNQLIAGYECQNPSTRTLARNAS